MYRCSQPPSVALPQLGQLTAQSPAAIRAALASLRELYWPAWIDEEAPVLLKSRSIHLSASQLHAALPRLDSSLSARSPDSGYAFAEDDEDATSSKEEDEEAEERLAVLRADPTERAYTVRWLTGLIARSEEWVGDDMTKANVVEDAAALLARCADTQADGALARRFAFGSVAVELWDEPYADDPACVGLQTWGSACVLAARLCADPPAFGLARVGRVRVLELGAGTGLLSLAVAGRCPHAEVIATDFHPAVLTNLRGNIARNNATVRVEALDWARPPSVDEAERFDVILGADVIYDVRHSGWIKRCAEALLRRETGLMWVIVPRRPTRGGQVAGVNDVFANGEGDLKIQNVEELERRRGVGRADEPGYKLFKIGW